MELFFDDFVFWNRGYINGKVTVSHNIFPGFYISNTNVFASSTVNITESMSMLVEPWNAGGVAREEAKVQGLVPLKAFDSELAISLKKTLSAFSNTLVYFYPGFDKDSLAMGYSPGDAYEGVPLDRFEQEKDVTGVLKPGHFRFYRSFPPPPIVGTRP